MGKRASSPLAAREATIPPDLVDLEATIAIQVAVIVELCAVKAAQAHYLPLTWQAPDPCRASTPRRIRPTCFVRP